jgi:hypothetical protein
MNTKPQTIDLTPRWQDIILAVVEAAPRSQDAKDELVRLAKYADETPALVRELVASLRGAVKAAHTAIESRTPSEFWDTAASKGLMEACEVLSKLEQAK